MQAFPGGIHISVEPGRAITIQNSLFGGVGLSRLGRAPKVVAPSLFYPFPAHSLCKQAAVQRYTAFA